MTGPGGLRCWVLLLAAASLAAAAPPAHEESRQLYAGSCTYIAFDTAKTVASGLGGATAIAVADVDGDADKDIAAAGFTADKVQWHENDGRPRGAGDAPRRASKAERVRGRAPGASMPRGGRGRGLGARRRHADASARAEGEHENDDTC